MAFLSVVLYCGLISTVQGLPSPLVRAASSFSLFGSSLHLKHQNLLDGHRHSRDMKYPLYMMQLYQNLAKGNDTGLAVLENTIIKEYDTILSLSAKNFSETANRWTLSFDMSSVSSNNELKLAELRINLTSFKSHNFTVDIYYSKGGEENLFLGSLKSSLSARKNSLWMVLNVTSILQNYFQGQMDVQKEYIKSKDMRGRNVGTGTMELLEEQEHSPQYNTPAHVPYYSTEGVMLVLFTKVKPSENPTGFSTLIKTVESSKYVTIDKLSRISINRRHRRNRHEKYHLSMGNMPSLHVENEKALCRRVDMIVDFEDIGWSNWIVYPKKYNAYRCEGACPIPLNETFKPTNHAYMKSVIKFYQPERVECSQCVPVKMSPLSMLYYEKEEVVLRHHQEMIVEDCGCI